MKRLNNETIGEMVRLRNRGLSLRKIAKIFKVDHQSVNYWLNPFRYYRKKRF